MPSLRTRHQCEYQRAARETGGGGNVIEIARGKLNFSKNSQEKEKEKERKNLGNENFLSNELNVHG